MERNDSRRTAETCKRMLKTCGNCISYLIDENDNGNVTDFHHDRNKDSGFCAIRELFYIVQNDSKPCKNWVYDGETENEG